MNLEVDVLAKYVEKLRARTVEGHVSESPFSTIEEAIEDVRAGRMVVVCDAEDRENEGDLDAAGAVRHPGGDQLHGHPRRAG